MTHCKWPLNATPFAPRVIHLLPIGYHCAILVMYLAAVGIGLEAPLDTVYTFRKLQWWMAEGPMERNRKMAQFILSKGCLGPSYGSGKQCGVLLENMLLLVDLAMEWNDFAMWVEVLKKSGADKNLQLLGSALLV